MKVRIFRQRISQVHESENEINEWLAEEADNISVKFVEQSAYLTDNTDNAQPGYIVSVSLNKVRTEMSLHLLAYNLKRVMNIMGIKPLIQAIQT